MHSIDIISIRRVDRANPRKDGCAMLAKIDFRANGFQFEGCSLMRTPAPRNGLTVWFPRIDKEDGKVTFADDALRAAVLQTVLTAYRAIGGKNAEWIPRAVPDGETAASDEAHGDDATAGVARFLAAG
jgi:hypothetical protein